MTMGVSLRFLGVGRGKSVNGVLSDAGFLIVSGKESVLVDPGSDVLEALLSAKVKEVGAIVMTGASDVEKAVSIKTKKKSSVIVERHSWGALIVFPDARIGYVIDSVEPEVVKSCDVLVLVKKDESLIEKAKPKLAILTGFDAGEWEANPVYAARDIKTRTGVQTIAAEDNLVVDLVTYGAVSEQKSLQGFTKPA